MKIPVAIRNVFTLSLLTLLESLHLLVLLVVIVNWVSPLKYDPAVWNKYFPFLGSEIYHGLIEDNLRRNNSYSFSVPLMNFAVKFPTKITIVYWRCGACIIFMNWTGILIYIGS